MENDIAINDPEVSREIRQLEQKIGLFRDLKIDEAAFKGFRTTRGIHGQRHPDGQMVRLKIPLGRVSPGQLMAISGAAKEFGNGMLHITSRQDIQLYDVKLEDTPALWRRLEKAKLTILESGGNGVRNIVVPAIAGIDPKEPFDISTYVYETHRYFFRNPVCQQFGRKFKIAFSTNESDNANAFVHDIGFIPKLNAHREKGFKVLIGGGLGAAPHHAFIAHEFLKEDLLIPYTEAVLRIFDRYGERNRRNKARFKFLVKELGLEDINKLIEKEWPALTHKEYKIKNELTTPGDYPMSLASAFDEDEVDREWLKTNVLYQKQEGYAAVAIAMSSGNINHKEGFAIAEIAGKYSAGDIRFEINQAIILSFIDLKDIPQLYKELKTSGLAKPGFNSPVHIVSCLGTNVCKLAITNNAGLAAKLDECIRKEFPGLINDNSFRIRINGCPNSCCHVSLAPIGFYGCIIRAGNGVIPAVQLVLGGENKGSGSGVFAEKIIKIPVKRAVEAVRVLIWDFYRYKENEEHFSAYFRRMGKAYFFRLLEYFGDVHQTESSECYDWDATELFSLNVSEGDCAGFVFERPDQVQQEAETKIACSFEALSRKDYAGSIYYAYLAYINGAKSWLLNRNLSFSSHWSVLNRFDKNMPECNFDFQESFSGYVLRIREHEPGKDFAETYLDGAVSFVHAIKALSFS